MRLAANIIKDYNISGTVTCFEIAFLKSLYKKRLP